MKRHALASGILGLVVLSLPIAAHAQRQASEHVWEGTNNKSPQLPRCPRPGAIHYTVTINDRNNRTSVDWIGIGSPLHNRLVRVQGTMSDAQRGQKVAVLSGAAGKLQITVTRVSADAITLTHVMDGCWHTGDMKLKR